LRAKIIKEVLKTTPEKIHEVTTKKCLIGSIVSGSLGFNAQFANIIAAIFIACGQDVAHTVEGSLGITTTEIVGDQLYISIYLPDLVIGTVGGGTRLPAQKEALELLGISGGNKGNNAASFSEIVGAAVLAGEISLLAALSEGALASSHFRLTRGYKSS
jgi:hydroxymethylglutaryl-CoA reductase (NADPH)